jgi:hypothetical protein
VVLIGLLKGLEVLRVSFPVKQVLVAAFLLLLCLPAVAAPMVLPTEEASQMMPDKLGDFRATGAVRVSELNLFGKESPEDFNAYSSATRTYTSTKGGTFILTLIRTRSDPGAYALLSRYAAEMRSKGETLAKTDRVGTVGFATPARIVFFKGAALVSVAGRTTAAARDGQEQLVEFARSFADTLFSEENDFPALVKHLPDWEAASERAVYVVSHNSLQAAAGNRPILDAIDFSGGTEAVIAPYDSAQLVIVEFSTPQISVDNDARINARLKELRDAGQPVPTAYRRVGNYSVFVFNAPDEQAAARLIDGITYEKVVQWLGDNPRAFERAVREYNETTSNLIIGVVKASGFSALICLGVGGLVGGLVFIRRRAQQASTDKYSDAGGMLRLNIDEMTPQTDASRLLGKGDG